MDYFNYFLVFCAGIAAGFINTLAGNGSAVSLAVLAYLGLPINIANGTNRIGVMIQSLVGSYTFHKSGWLDWGQIIRLAIPTVIGSIVGVLLAVELPEKELNIILGALMLALLGIVLMKPKRWLEGQTTRVLSAYNWKSVLLLLAVGFYGGFIQAGVGVLFLATFVLVMGFDLKKANSIKVAIVAFYTLPAIVIFLYHNQINWFWGCWLALGQSIGAFVAARFAIKVPNANVWIRRLLIVILILAMFKFWGFV